MHDTASESAWNLCDGWHPHDPCALGAPSSGTVAWHHGGLVVHVDGHLLAWRDRRLLAFSWEGAYQLAGPAARPTAIGPRRSACLIPPPALQDGRLAETTTARAGLRWTWDGGPLPDGAEDAAVLHPFPTGRGVAWVSEGFAWRWDGARASCVGAAVEPQELMVGPDGALLLVEAEALLAVAPPGGPLRALQEDLALGPGPVFFATDGSSAAVLDDRRRPVRVDLRAGTARRDGRLPWADGDGARFDAARGEVRRGEALFRGGLRGGLVALSGSRLWAADDLILDLNDGRMFRVESELPGALRAPLGDGFVAVAADGSREVFGADGLLVAALPGDLDEDEGIVALRVDARGTFAERLSGWVALNADGSWGSLAEDPPLPADPPDEDALRAAGLPPLPMDGAATVDGRLVAWRDDGMILLGRR